MEAQHENAQELKTLHKIRRTIFQMLNDRSYLVGPDELNTTYEEFVEQYGSTNEKNRRDAMTIMVNHRYEKNELVVYFFDSDKLRVQDLNSFKNKMRTHKKERAIIVHDAVVSPKVKELLSIINNRKGQKPEDTLRIELFCREELMFNVTHHSLVSEHILLTNEEKQALLKRYRLKESQLPRIQAVDVVSRYYGLKKGQVVKIIRPSETAGRYVTYRLVF